MSYLFTSVFLDAARGGLAAVRPVLPDLLAGVAEPTGETEDTHEWWRTTERWWDSAPHDHDLEVEHRRFTVRYVPGLPLHWVDDAAAFVERCREGLGVDPDGSVGLWFGSSRQEFDHRALGELAWAIADRTGGVVELEASSFRHGDEPPALPGRIVPAPDPCSYLADAAYLHAWLRHPDFRMY